jgi:hypothetical protein
MWCSHKQSCLLFSPRGAKHRQQENVKYHAAAGWKHIEMVTA